VCFVGERDGHGKCRFGGTIGGILDGRVFVGTKLAAIDSEVLPRDSGELSPLRGIDYDAFQGFVLLPEDQRFARTRTQGESRKRRQGRPNSAGEACRRIVSLTLTIDSKMN